MRERLGDGLGRGVVDDDYLKVAVVALEDRVEATRELVRPISRGYDD